MFLQSTSLPSGPSGTPKLIWFGFFFDPHTWGEAHSAIKLPPGGPNIEHKTPPENSSAQLMSSQQAGALFFCITIAISAIGPEYHPLYCRGRFGLLCWPPLVVYCILAGGPKRSTMDRATRMKISPRGTMDEKGLVFGAVHCWKPYTVKGGMRRQVARTCNPPCFTPFTKLPHFNPPPPHAADPRSK
ncbi:hypothetical protein JTE90_005384 [Oedothorax gibbosus]|uniref:Uncharacterized protein n=1 Tax=Oedothorax gibbosus TaxID=931172 RepID=A0AAV6V8Y9_9ARAC|nr:hypothetical protein JTE90_005384 [Oedothorax gibbosus]